MRCIPQRKRQSPACPTSSVAWCRNSSPDSRDVWKNGNSIDGISLTSVWSFKRHKKQGRHSERRTDQRQRELPVPMSDQPQLQPFQSRVQKKRRKSNALPQRPLQKQASQSRQALSKSVRYLLVLLIEKQPSLHSKYIGRM